MVTKILINGLFGYWSSWEETIFVYIWIYLMYWGLEPICLDRCFWELMIFEWNNRAEWWLIFKDSCVIYVIVCAFFLCDCLLSVYLPFCFLSCLNTVFNSFRIHTYMLWLLFHIFTNISSKVDMEFILWCSILMDCSCFFPIAWKSMNNYS